MSPVEWSALPELDLPGVRDAVSRIAVRTPLLRAPSLDRSLQSVPDAGDGAGDGGGGSAEGAKGTASVFLKLESLQVTGSFKIRGAAARISALSLEERSRGVVACSSGNHGLAVAHVAGRLGIPATICVPEWVDPVKKDAMEDAGANVVLAGATYDQAAERAEAERRERGAIFIHPFDDRRVVAGQGTIGLEIGEDLPHVGTVVVPLSGGGLAGGVAWFLKRTRPGVRIVAASARRARVMVESVRAGEPVGMEEEETLASALSGGIGLENRYTLRLIEALVDEHVLVDEDAIARAMTLAAERLNLVVEGGGAVGLAAWLSGELAPSRKPVVVVISGGNVSLETLVRLRTS